MTIWLVFCALLVYTNGRTNGGTDNWFKGVRYVIIITVNNYHSYLHVLIINISQHVQHIRLYFHYIGISSLIQTLQFSNFFFKIALLINTFTIEEMYKHMSFRKFIIFFSSFKLLTFNIKEYLTK